METEVVKPQIVLIEFYIAGTTTTPVTTAPTTTTPVTTAPTTTTPVTTAPTTTTPFTTAGTTARGFYMTCLMVTRERNCLKLAKKICNVMKR